MSNYNILIVEDNRFISDMYLHSLQKAGYNVEVVVSGPEGIEKVKSGDFQVMLLDIMLPDKTGIEVLTELRGTEDDAPNTRILIMTNYNLDDKTREEMEKMADGYLIKADVTPTEVVEIINKIKDENA